MRVIGLLGVGHMADALVPGLLRGHPAEAVLLGPRNAQRAETLSHRYGLAVAESASALVERCDAVILATRPAQAADAVHGLPWRDGQTVISVCAGVKHAALAPKVAPATLVRAMPISAAALGASPTTIYPDRERAHDVLAPLGPVIPIGDEAAFDVASASGAYYGWVFAIMQEAAAALIAKGLAPDLANALIAETTAAAGGVAAAAPGHAPGEWLTQLATPGGITEQGLAILRDRGALDVVKAATNAVAERLSDVGGTAANKLGTSADVPT